jgi:hypothetical protein
LIMRVWLGYVFPDRGGLSCCPIVLGSQASVQ